MTRKHVSSTIAAQKLGVSDETIRRYCRDGVLQHFRTPGKHYRVFSDQLQRIIEPVKTVATV